MKEVLISILGKLYIRPFLYAIKILKVIEMDYGHFRSALKGIPIDNRNNPLPWYSYPAIDYLNQLNLSKKIVFEYGSGYSTLFWSRKTKQVISVEDNHKWFEKIKLMSRTRKNINLKYINKNYPSSIKDFKRKFDIIVIDGSQRPECAKTSIKYLKKGGIVILDNSDWFPKTAKFLRSKFLEIDFSGLVPSLPYSTTTSFFLSKNTLLEGSRQPNHPLGGLKHNLG